MDTPVVKTIPPKKQKVKFSPKRFFVFPVSPRRQFRNLIIAWLVLFAVLVVFHIRYFNQAASHSIFKASPVAPLAVPKVNEKKLKSVLIRYEAKKTVQTDAVELTPLVAEPEK